MAYFTSFQPEALHHMRNLNRSNTLLEQWASLNYRHWDS